MKTYEFTMDYDDGDATFTIKDSFTGTYDEALNYRNGLFNQGYYNIDMFCWEDEM